MPTIYFLIENHLGHLSLTSYDDHLIICFFRFLHSLTRAYLFLIVDMLKAMTVMTVMVMMILVSIDDICEKKDDGECKNCNIEHKSFAAKMHSVDGS